VARPLLHYGRRCLLCLTAICKTVRGGPLACSVAMATRPACGRSFLRPTVSAHDPLPLDGGQRVGSPDRRELYGKANTDSPPSPPSPQLGLVREFCTKQDARGPARLL